LRAAISVSNDGWHLGKRKNILEVLTLAREKAPDIEIRFSIEDAFRTRLDNLLLIYNSVSQLNLINRLGVADTVGYALPMDVERVIKFLKVLSKKDIEFHGHDDTGLKILIIFFQDVLIRLSTLFLTLLQSLGCRIEYF
jgi:HMGL-like